MPNHLMSKLHFSGEQKKINELLESIKGEETLFDFNKVLPMPESLNIEAGSRTDNGLKAYKDLQRERERQANFETLTNFV